MFPILPVDHVEAPVIKEVLGYWPSYNTTVAVIGAHQGSTVAFVREHSPDALIYAVEPQDWCIDILHQRFNDDPKVIVLGAALGVTGGQFPLYEYGTDACSLLKLPNSRQQGEGLMLEARQWWKNQDEELGPIRFVIMNIEGYEYWLLPHLSTQLLYTKVLVQEHRGLWPDWSSYSYPMWAGFKKRREIGAGWSLYE